MASERAAELADDFAVANAEAIAFAQSCSEADWALSVPGEGWTVGVVMHHIAEGHSHAFHWLQAMAAGEGVHETAEDVDRGNAEHAVRSEAISADETVSLLEEKGVRLERTLRALTDDDLAQTAPFGPAGGRVLPTGDLAPVAARHTREHLGHAQSAVHHHP
jgi:hypothetical protein